MSEEIWIIKKNLCRCCHAEGDFDNLAEPRVSLKQEEIYFNMLRECFNIEIPPVPGELCTMTYSICNVCILRLQDASSFKKQVQRCEERFMALYCNNSVKVLNSKKPLFKLENSESDTDYNEDLNDENDEEYKSYIIQDEDNPNSDEDKYLTLRKGKKKIEPKSYKLKHTPNIRQYVKKAKSSVKEKKDATMAESTTSEESSNALIVQVDRHCSQLSASIATTNNAYVTENRATRDISSIDHGYPKTAAEQMEEYRGWEKEDIPIVNHLIRKKSGAERSREYRARKKAKAQSAAKNISSFTDD